jgi:hypothetical protein
MKPDFIITCLGLFLIILVALMIGRSINIEGFEYLNDFNVEITNLKTNSINLINFLNSSKNDKISSDVNNLLTNVKAYVSEADIAQINSGQEVVFLNALEDMRKYISNISIINDNSFKNLKQQINGNIFKITNIVNDNINNYNLPIEMRQLLGKIWWDCTKVYDLISDDNLANEFKISSEMVTYYLSPKTFIFSAEYIGKPNDNANTKYVYLINSLEDKVEKVHQKEPSAIDSNKSTILTDLSNLKTYVKTGTFATQATTALTK